MNIDNIENGINAVLPSAIDINSGIESKPGMKDKKKMKALFDIIKNRTSVVNPFEIPVLGGSHEL